ncbi:MAG: hypothetical protein K5663_11220 [Clostridiales bacterium]|nr:hypothetical protein [Clostridiales bacterium]
MQGVDYMQAVSPEKDERSYSLDEILWAVKSLKEAVTGGEHVSDWKDKILSYCEDWLDALASDIDSLDEEIDEELKQAARSGYCD